MTEYREEGYGFEGQFNPGDKITYLGLDGVVDSVGVRTDSPAWMVPLVLDKAKGWITIGHSDIVKPRKAKKK